MGEKRVFLKDRIDSAFIGRQIGNILAVKDHFAGSGIFKTADNAQRRGLAATGRTQQGNKFFFADVEIDIR